MSRPARLTVLHAVLATLASIQLARALQQDWLRDVIVDADARALYQVGLPVASAVASVLSIALGVRSGLIRRAATTDLAGLAAAFVALGLLARGPETRAVVGLLYVAVIAVRLLPSVLLVVRGIEHRDAGARGRRSPPFARGPMTAGFVVLNAALIATLLLAPIGGDVEFSGTLVTRWLPFALALATALTLVLARGAIDRRGSLRDHFWGCLAVPATLALATFGSGLEPGVIGAPYVALVGFIAARGLRELWRTRGLRTDRALGRLLGLVALATTLALLPFDRTAQLTAADEPHYLLIMESLVRDHDLDLKNEYDSPSYYDFYPEPLPDRHVIIVGDRQPPIRDLGLPLLGAIPFAIARRTGVLVLMCLIAAAFAWRGYALLRTLTFSRDASILSIAAVVFLHPVFTYATQIYPDLPAALVVLLVAGLLARPPSVGRLGAASALLGTLPWLTVRGWLPVVGMGLVVAFLALRPLARGITRDRLALVAAAAAPFAALVLGLALLDEQLFGIPLPNAGYILVRDAQPVLVYAPQVGIAGLFLDRTFGLLSHVPLYGLLFFGAVPLLRLARATRSPALVALFLGWLTYLLYIGDLAYWWADGSPSSRYLLATIAFPLVALAAAFEQLRGDGPRLVAQAAAWWSVVVTATFALLPNLRYDLAAEMRDGGGPGKLWVFGSKALRLDPGLLFPSLVRDATSDIALAVAWSTVLVGLIVLGARTTRPSPTAPAP